MSDYEAKIREAVKYLRMKARETNDKGYEELAEAIWELRDCIEALAKGYEVACYGPWMTV